MRYVGEAIVAVAAESVEIAKEALSKIKIIYEDLQPGDVEATFAETSSLEEWVNFKPNTSIDEGVKNFVDWYLDYYKKN